MSAIGAIFSACAPAPDSPQRLLEALRHTPFEQSGVWQEGVFALAASVFHSTPESCQTRQPIIGRDARYAAVFDGYLANREELISRLGAQNLSASAWSDAEIALRAYEVWQEGCALRLEGEFALIVADLPNRRLYACRDHIGLAPLFYREEQGSLVIASDLRTIIDLGNGTDRPDELFLAQAASNCWVLPEATAWKGVKRLPPAHFLTFDGTRVTTQEYWVPPTTISIRYKRDEEYVEHYRELLADCVRRAARSDAPLAVAVSGGLDSTAVFAFADALEKAGELKAPSLRGYCLAASEDSEAYELPYARSAAQFLGRELTEVALFDPPASWYAEDSERHLDIAIPSNGAMMLDMEKRVVEDGCRVILNGTGGDEWLNGSGQYYREFAARLEVARYVRALREDAQAFGWVSALRNAARQTIGEFTPAPLRRSVGRLLRPDRDRIHAGRQWLKPHLREALDQAERDYFDRLPGAAIDSVKVNLVRTPFGQISKSVMRRQRAAIGLESRDPMLSRAFIEFSSQTPLHIKRRGDVTKLVHRKALAGMLPEKVINRWSKANFANSRIDAEFSSYVAAHSADQLSQICDMDALKAFITRDLSAVERDEWAWEIWGLYASAAFLYQNA